MTDLLFALITLVSSCVGLYFSWYCFKREKWNLSLFFLILVGLILRIYTSSDLYLHTWDERYHALVAKNLINHPFKPTLYEYPLLEYDYKNWTGNYIWLHKQPFSLWLISMSLTCFGINEFAVRIPSILMTSAGIWMTFYIAKYLFNNKIATIAAFLFAINGLIIELTAGRVATDHIDISFLFFIELSIVFTIRFIQTNKGYYNIIAGVFMGIAILTKWLPGLIVTPIWLLLIYESQKFKLKQILLYFIVFISIAIMVFIPWQIYVYKYFPLEAKWESSFNMKHFFEVVEERTGNYFYYIHQLRKNYGDIIYLPLIWFLYKITKNIKNYKNLALLVWIGIPFMFFTLAQTKMQAYILFTSPALFIVTAYFFDEITMFKENVKIKRLVSIVQILIILLPLRYMLERVKPFNSTNRNPNWALDLKALNHERFNNGVLFNCTNYIEAMFYTDLIAYEKVPDKKTIIALQKKGKKIIINQNYPIPNEIKTIKGIVYLKLRNE